LEGKLAFLGIAEVVRRVLERTPKTKFGAMGDMLAADAEARRVAGEEIEKIRK
jgi:1-deoxy-D-xylulose 5-phosphate reductoisomerase